MGWVGSGWVIPYDTGCCVNVRLKADTSQLKIPHENQQLNSGKTEKPNSKKTGKLRRIGKQSGESVESVLEKQRKATVYVVSYKGG